jgi:hypothetical protein
MTSFPDKQKTHEFAIGFAAAEYNNEINRRREKGETFEKPQQGVPVFLYLYEQAFKDFKRSPHCISDD